MMSAALRPSLTLAIHPNTRGFGWVAFDGPFNAHDWALIHADGDKNSKCLRSVERLFERLQPETLVLEAFERSSSQRADRIARLCRAIVALAVDRRIEVAVYRRGDVQATFASVGARTRHEIAQAVARHVEALRPRLPAQRKPWQSEDKRMPLFAAAALVLTHFQLGATTLFDQLSEDAAS